MSEESLDYGGTYLTTMKRLEAVPQIYDEKRRVVSDVGDAERLPLDDVLEPRIRLIASLVLIQEGILTIDPSEEGGVELTEAGRRRFNGIKALSRG